MHTFVCVCVCVCMCVCCQPASFSLGADRAEPPPISRSFLYFSFFFVSGIPPTSVYGYVSITLLCISISLLATTHMHQIGVGYLQHIENKYIH